MVSFKSAFCPTWVDLTAKMEIIFDPLCPAAQWLSVDEEEEWTLCDNCSLAFGVETVTIGKN